MKKNVLYLPKRAIIDFVLLGLFQKFHNNLISKILRLESIFNQIVNYCYTNNKCFVIIYTFCIGKLVFDTVFLAILFYYTHTHTHKHTHTHTHTHTHVYIYIYEYVSNTMF